ncbi:T7SS effector LXG polymorphic toxin, partial [Shouchella clausii]
SLPKIDTSAVQKGIHDAKQHAMNTVEKLYAFDHAQSAAVDQLISLMAPISSFVAGLNGAIESGVSITALAGYIASQDVPPEIKAMHPMLNGTYNVLTPYQNFNDQAVHTQNFLLSPNPFGFIHFSNPFILNVAKRFYLAGGHIDVVHHYSPDYQIAGTTVDANGNKVASVSEMIEAGKGQITYEWDKPQGDHIQARGVPVDYEALGIVPETVVVDGYAINYTVQDGQFILFRDNPDLEYYTQSAKRGKIETEVAKLTQLAADGVGTFFIYRTFDLVKKIPFVNDMWDKVIEKIPESAAKGAQVYGSFKIQESVPYWSEIVGTPVPDAGTEEVLVYISDSGGEEWNGRVLLTIHPDGNVTPRK